MNDLILLDMFVASLVEIDSVVISLALHTDRKTYMKAHVSKKKPFQAQGTQKLFFFDHYTYYFDYTVIYYRLCDIIKQQFNYVYTYNILDTILGEMRFKPCCR